MHRGLLFDLDGVIVDTARYHYLAWKTTADMLHIPFSRQENERLKGVSRMKSLEIILSLAGLQLDDGRKKELCTFKNEIYLSYIHQLTPEDILPGVLEFLTDVRDRGYLTALGSASRNASLILEKLSLTDYFDSVIDGNMVSKAKPDPEVFSSGAHSLHLAPEECIVFEDAAAGIQAAHRGGMKAVGIGSRQQLWEADYIMSGFRGAAIQSIENAI